MAVLPGSIYLTIATNIANAKDSVASTVPLFYNNVYEVVLLDDVRQTLDLLQSFYNSYLLSDAAFSSNTYFTSVVTTLNNHAITRGGYNNINEYLDAEAIQVPATFAEISALTGFTISAGNIA